MARSSKPALARYAFVTAAIAAVLLLIGPRVMGPVSLLAVTVTDNFGTGVYADRWDEVDGGVAGRYSDGSGNISSVGNAEDIIAWKTSINDFTDVQRLDVKLVAISSSGSGAMAQVSGTGAALQGYAFLVAGSGTAGKLYKITAGFSYALLGSYSNISTSDTIGVQANGGTITPYINGVAQSSQVDGSPLTGGQLGLYSYFTGTTFDDVVMVDSSAGVACRSLLLMGAGC